MCDHFGVRKCKENVIQTSSWIARVRFSQTCPPAVQRNPEGFVALVRDAFSPPQCWRRSSRSFRPPPVPNSVPCAGKVGPNQVGANAHWHLLTHIWELAKTKGNHNPIWASEVYKMAVEIVEGFDMLGDLLRDPARWRSKVHAFCFLPPG